MSQSLLPPASTPLERALDETTARISGLPVGIGALWSTAHCPEEKLPWLAWSFGVEVWSYRWGNVRKRKQIAASIPIKRIKGSIGAVTRALGELGFLVRVQEWFSQSPYGAPYTYQLHIEVDQVGFDLEDIADMLEMVDRTKNLRSHLDVIKPAIKTRAEIHYGAVANIGTEINTDSGIAYYPDGTPAIDLAMHAGTYGLDETLDAIAAISQIVNQALPTVTP